MPTISITVTQAMADAFTAYLADYNARNGTSLTPSQWLKQEGKGAILRWRLNRFRDSLAATQATDADAQAAVEAARLDGLLV